MEYLYRKPLITFVVPAYNVERTISAALYSLLGQSSGNWEAVVVDDGSTDTTGELVDKVSAQSRNVRVVHQANTGVSAARNAGIEIAQGEYLAFLDADDSVMPDYVEKLEVALQNKRPDVIALSYRSFPRGNTFGYGSFEGNSTDFLKMALRNRHSTFPCWLFLVTKKLVLDMNIGFTVGRRTGEDQEFVLKALCCSSRCLSVDRDDIYYCYHAASTTSAMASNLEGQFDYSRAMKSVLDYFAVCEGFRTSFDEEPLRRLLFERCIDACSYAIEIALQNGGAYSDVKQWGEDIISEIGLTADELKICPSYKSRCFLFLWRNCRVGLLRFIKAKPYVYEAVRKITKVFVGC